MMLFTINSIKYFSDNQDVRRICSMIMIYFMSGGEENVTGVSSCILYACMQFLYAVAYGSESLED